ncbi:MAG: hypothetical protein ACC663_05010 [Gammaproteobacteria bacterium]
MSDRRALLLRATKYFAGISLLALLFVSLDFLIDFKPASIQSSYRFSLRELPVDRPVWLRQDNLVIVVIHRSPRLIEALTQADDRLQDPDSKSSRQPQYAKNRLRSRSAAYFVAYGRGTDFECPLESGNGEILRETCGGAQYDFAGRALAGKNQFQNLAIPDYTFNDNFTLLTINPWGDR